MPIRSKALQALVHAVNENPVILKLSDDSSTKLQKPSLQNSVIRRNPLSFCPKHEFRGNIKHHYLGGLRSFEEYRKMIICRNHFVPAATKPCNVAWFKSAIVIKKKLSTKYIFWLQLRQSNYLA